MSERRIKVILTKVGLDTHDTGLKLVSRMLRDAGMEVVYLGRFQTPETIVKAAAQEDADVVGISYLSSGYSLQVREVIHLLKENNLENVVVIVGGIVPEPRVSELKRAGVHDVFGAHTASDTIIECITSAVGNMRRQ